MKYLNLLIIFLIALQACKKQDPSESLDGQLKTKVVFTVSNFQQQVTPIAGANASVSAETDSLNKLVDNLYCYIFDNWGSLTKTIVQTSSSSDFGTISTGLDTGSYDVAFIASKGVLHFNNISSLSTLTFTPGTAYWDDTFLKKVHIDIENSQLHVPVKLERVVGGIKVELRDSIRYGYLDLTLVVENDAEGFHVNSEQGFGSVSRSKLFPYYNFQNNSFPKTAFIHVMKTSAPLSMRINGRTFDYTTEKAVTDISIQKNKITTVTGYLFEQANFRIGINSVWEPPLHIDF